MPVTGLKHQINAYTIEAAGTPVATIKAASILDAMRFVLDGLDLTGNGWWDGEEPLAVRNANWLEKDALLLETKKKSTKNGPMTNTSYIGIRVRLRLLRMRLTTSIPSTKSFLHDIMTAKKRRDD